MKLCKHIPHRVIADIKSPKWSTNEVLISTTKVPESIEHFIIQFTDESPKKKYGWFVLSGKQIRRSPKQANGRGEVYAVKMSGAKAFEPIKDCTCENIELDLFN